MVPCRDELRMTEEVRVRRLAPHPVTLSGAAKAQPKPRSRTGLLHSPLCHFDRGKKQPRLTEWRNLARKRYGKQTSSFFMPSPFLRGKGDRLRWMRVVPTLLFLHLLKTKTVSPHQALRASFPLRGKPCVEACSERVTVLHKIPRLTLGMTRTVLFSEILRCVRLRRTYSG